MFWERGAASRQTEVNALGVCVCVCVRVCFGTGVLPKRKGMQMCATKQP